MIVQIYYMACLDSILASHAFALCNSAINPYYRTRTIETNRDKNTTTVSVGIVQPIGRLYNPILVH